MAVRLNLCRLLFSFNPLPLVSSDSQTQPMLENDYEICLRESQRRDCNCSLFFPMGRSAGICSPRKEKKLRFPTRSLELLLLYTKRNERIEQIHYELEADLKWHAELVKEVQELKSD